MNPLFENAQKGFAGSFKSEHYIHILELPSNPLILSRYLMRVYDRKTIVERGYKNQRVKYIENDEYPNWRENASVLEQYASIPSEGKGWLFEMNNSYNRYRG